VVRLPSQLSNGSISPAHVAEHGVAADIGTEGFLEQHATSTRSSRRATLVRMAGLAKIPGTAPSRRALSRWNG
jgi:hypothetical protein